MKIRYISFALYLQITAIVIFSCDFINPLFDENGSLAIKCIINKQQLDKASDVSSPLEIVRIRCILYKGSSIKKDFDLVKEDNKFKGSKKLKKGTYDVKVEAYEESNSQAPAYTGSASNVEVSPLKTTDVIIILEPTEVDLTTSVSPSNGGNISKKPDKTKYDYGETIQLTASPDSGYKFDHWEGDLSGNSNPVAITMNGNKSVIAVFVPKSVTISGYVKDNTGNPISGVTITLSNNGGATTTNSSGYYSQTVTQGWSGTVTPTYYGYTFSPTNKSYTNVISDQTNQNFTGTPIYPVISGYVRDNVANPIWGVTLTFSNNGGTATTNSSGYYSRIVTYAWSGTAAPSYDGYTFSPANRSYTNVTSDQSDQNFTGIPSEIISTPNSPSGSSNGNVGQSLSFSTGGSTSNLGHAVEYQFDWGDGNYSNWGSSTQSYVYNNVGTYQIKAQARCQTHTSVVSNWSQSRSISISGHTLNITINPTGSGSVTKNPNKSQYNHNEIVELTASPSSSYQFDHWEGDLSGNSNPASMTMSGNKNVTAVFQQPKVATPTFNPPEGTYTSAQNVAITCATSGATIRYTTNGIDPTESDPIYSTPILISTMTTLKARAYKTGWTPSDVKSGIYEIIRGLVAHYPFNGNTNDESGYGNHGNVIGPTLTMDRFCNNNKAYSFDGINDEIDIPHSTSLNISGDITVCAWVNIFIKEGDHAVIDKREREMYKLNMSGDNPNFEMGNGSPASANDSLVIGQWYFLTGIYRASNGQREIYMDGILKGTNSNATTVYPNTLSLKIGRRRLDGSQYFNGVIDDVRIYSYALSISEIQQFYEEGGKIIFQDSFESYTINTFPSSGGWSLRYNGAGDSYQVVTNTDHHPGSQSMQMKGAPSWTAQMEKSVSMSSNVICYQGWIKPTGNDGGFGLINNQVPTTGNYGNVFFDQGKIKCQVGYNLTVEIQDFNVNQWYQIKLKYDHVNKTIDVWINGSLKIQSLAAINISPLGPNVFYMWSEHEGNIFYFDDIMVWCE